VVIYHYSMKGSISFPLHRTDPASQSRQDSRAVAHYFMMERAAYSVIEMDIR
jgi:hypothetical protein